MVFMVGLIAISVQSLNAQKKEFTETIEKEIAFTNKADNEFILQNISGSITVEAYSGNTVKLAVEKIVTSRSDEKLALGKKEVGIKVERNAGNITVYPDAPNLVFKNGSLNTVNCNNYADSGYDYRLNFTVKVPQNSKVEVATVNHGDIVINNMRGEFVKAGNINGHITLNNISGQTEVNAINGEVNISYISNPKAPSRYYALNGDINVKFQRDLSAEIAFKSMNGEFYTDFDIAKQFAKTSRSNGKNAKFKYEAKPVVQIGSGALDHSFETLNGNVLINKI